jgi:WD40 repeat protein
VIICQPSRAVAANPVAFQLPEGVSRHAGLPYKSIFAVLTEISIIIYDTYHNKPIALARGLHYSGLTDAVWTPDGHTLVVSSSDGYISFIVFQKGELGQVYQQTCHSVKAEIGKSLLDKSHTKSKETSLGMAEKKINVLQPRKRNVTTPAGMHESLLASDTVRPSVIKEVANSESNVEKAKSHTVINTLQPRRIKRVATKVVINEMQ